MDNLNVANIIQGVLQFSLDVLRKSINDES